MTAKKEISPAQGLANFWDELARYIVRYRVRVLAGDFNMALWQVVPELRVRGLCVNIVANYVFRTARDTDARIDSTGLFYVGPHSGVAPLFGPAHLRGGGDPPPGFEEIWEPDEPAVAGGAPRRRYSRADRHGLRLPVDELSTEGAEAARKARDVDVDAQH